MLYENIYYSTKTSLYFCMKLQKKHHFLIFKKSCDISISICVIIVNQNYIFSNRLFWHVLQPVSCLDRHKKYKLICPDPEIILSHYCSQVLYLNFLGVIVQHILGHLYIGNTIFQNFFTNNRLLHTALTNYDRWHQKLSQDIRLVYNL